MARNEFETEIGILLKSLFPVAERLDDVAFNRKGGRQVTKKPWDYYGCDKYGSFWVAEVKRVRTGHFPFSNLKQHQGEALQLVSHINDDRSWLFINWRLGGHRGTGTAIWIPYSYYTAREGTLISECRKSARADHFPEHWQLERVTGGWRVPERHPYHHVLI